MHIHFPIFSSFSCFTHEGTRKLHQPKRDDNTENTWYTDDDAEKTTDKPRDNYFVFPPNSRPCSMLHVRLFKELLLT